MLVFFVVKTAVLVELTPSTRLTRGTEYVCFLFFIPVFFSLIRHYIKTSRLYNKFKEFEKFVDTSVLVSKADKNGKITYVNKKFSEVSGWSLEEAIGKDHKIVNSGYHPKEMWQEMYKTTIVDKQIWNKVVTNISKDGHLYWVDSYIKAEFRGNGELKGFTSLRYDVSDVKKKELEIRNRMNAINQSNAVIEFDLTGTIMYANKNFCDVMGYDMEEITGKHHRIFLTEDYSNSVEYKEFWDKLKGGNFISAQFTRIKKNGDEIWLQATYNPIFDNDNKVIRIMKIAIDITDKVLQGNDTNGAGYAIFHSGVWMSTSSINSLTFLDVNGGIADTSLGKFMFENITTAATNAQGFTAADYATALNLLNNTDEYQFNLLMTPGLFLSAGSAPAIGSNGADPIVQQAMTRDYSGLMKAINKKKGM